jgi:hypothetical protein
MEIWVLVIHAWMTPYPSDNGFVKVFGPISSYEKCIAIKEYMRSNPPQNNAIDHSTIGCTELETPK